MLDSVKGGLNGCDLRRTNDRAFRPLLALHKASGKYLKGTPMEIFYWIGGVLAGLLLVYLIVALLKPEMFS